MLIKAVQEITDISDNQEINSANYFEAINYINNLYKIINIMKMVSDCKEMVFLPTFKGKYTCEKYNIESTEKENEMKYFEIQSASFLEDRVKKDITKAFMYVEFGYELSFDKSKIIITLD